MNFRKFFSLKTWPCQYGSGSKIYPSAGIHNFQNRTEKIRIGRYTHIRGEILVFGHGGEIRIGDYCYVGEGARIWSADNIRIGNRVLISHLVSIYDSTTHPLRADLRHAHYREILRSGHPKKIALGERPVELCDDVWIGSHAVILRGVTLGRGCVVAAGSVVTRSCAEFSLVAGNPAKEIRKLEQPPSTFYSDYELR